MKPLVITLAVDDVAQQHFDAERTRLFPVGRTQVGAHVTLFHAVPGELEAQVRNDLVQACGPRFPVGVAGVLPLGRGAAYALASPELARRHRALQRQWWPYLTAQDQQGFRPHVTVQNKVSPAEARATLALLRRAFRPYEISATGFVLWRYDDGPWTELARFEFPPAG
ncbi:MAG: 2'-5' RNA ligase family protein [Jatrophihabitans sp.]